MIGRKHVWIKMEDARPRGRPTKTWRSVVKKDCWTRQLNKDNDMDCSASLFIAYSRWSVAVPTMRRYSFQSAAFHQVVWMPKFI